MLDLIPFREDSEPKREHLAVVTQVELSALHPGVQLRVGKVDRDHVNVLTLTAGKWPPIVVRRSDNTIVDGHYRYMAARQLGRTHIDCIYFDGGEESAFLEALRQNRDHGLPLSLQDRRAAARQLLGFHPDWSDRRVATTCSLAPGTVARIRASMPNRTGESASSDQSGQLNTRVGLDGRRRPVNARASRRQILSALRAKPEGSLRDTARLTGASPATVRAILASQEHRSDREPRTAAPAPSPCWISDAAVLSTEDGESFARWFQRTDVRTDWESFVDAIPVSRIYEIADEARRRSAAWLQFATAVEGRVRSHPGRGTCR